MTTHLYAALNTIRALEHQSTGRPCEQYEDARWQSMLEGDLLDALERGDDEFGAEVCKLLHELDRDERMVFSYEHGGPVTDYFPPWTSEEIPFE